MSQHRAHITVLSKIWNPDTVRFEADPEGITRQEVQGELIRKEKSWYIRYQEVAEGLENTTTIWKIHSEGATLLRSGDVRMRQEFIPGSRTEGIYETPYGKLGLMVRTDDFQWVVRENIGTASFELQYGMEIQGEQSEISIHVGVKW